MRRVISTVAVAAAAALIAACGSSGSSSNSSSRKAGDITIGLVTTLTGPAASEFYGNVQAAQARIDVENAHGGVNGHEIKLVTADDGTSAQGASTAVSNLINNKHVFALIFQSDFTGGGAYRIAHQAGVPVLGFPADGPEWGQQPNTNMISDVGNVPPTGIGGIVNTSSANVAKLLGAKNLAVLAIGGEQPSIQGAQSEAKADRAAGVKVGYTNYSIPIGTVDVTSEVLAMKQAGVDGFQTALLDNTNIALLTTAKQVGLHLVAPMLETDYGQTLLDQPSALQAAQGAIFEVFQRPVEEPNAATKAEQQAFATYEHFTGIPSMQWSESWILADLFIQGLKGAGANPTRTSLLNNLHNLKGYNAGGLMAAPIDLSLKDFGHAPVQQCNYFVQLKGKTFVPINGGKPICGKTIK
ncbi:MAG: ABC transporter substrate-binding protein [Acidimicrobiaceae bacterium]|nr:ABC transporter substrate-binding protein [Acidimicrobiaceae bacterium]